MNIDTTQQALKALADNPPNTTIPAEAYILGYKKGWDQALALAIKIEQAINTNQLFSDRNPA